MKPQLRPIKPLGAIGALVFNLCLFVLPLASAAALHLINRDSLYAYELSPSSQRSVRTQVERLASELILLDFDRTRQWDDLIAMELMNGDVQAARGFLLSARRILPPREANEIDRRLRGDASDADIELATLDLLTPGTRARYEATVPLLSRRSASGAVQTRPPEAWLGDERDFELLAQAMLGDAQSDPLQFVLTGLGLGLGGEFSPRMRAGASALLAASRREDYPAELAEEVRILVEAAAPMARFRAAATRLPEGQDAALYANAATAFRAAVTGEHARTLKAALDEIGAMSEATSVAGAAVMLSHARNLRDLPRLRLVAQAAGDRAVAVAKSLPREGQLPRLARGALTYNGQLIGALAIVAAAALGAACLALFGLFVAAKHAFEDLTQDFEAGGELVESFRQNWHPL